MCRVQINGENVTTATHSHTVQLIRSSGDAICLKIITPPRRRLDRPQPPERVAISWQQEPVRQSNGVPSKDCVQQGVNKTPRSIAVSNAMPSQTTDEHLPSGQPLPPPRLPTARSMPDLTAATDYQNAPDRTHRNQSDNWTGKVNNGVQKVSSGGDDMDRVLYELTNQLRPSTVVTQPPLDVTSSAQRTDNVGTASENRPQTNSQKRPVPPPRATSLSTRLQASSPAVSLLTASRAKSTGSEFKELLTVGGHAGTSSQLDGHQEQKFHNSTSTPARSIISGEHLVLPSQLKKLQRPPTDDDTKKHQDQVQETKTSIPPSYDGLKLNGHSSIGTHQAIIKHRSPVPKRPAPPPPSTKLTATPATNGEVNFLVMAEQARKQYILSKLARDTLTANNAALRSTAPTADDYHLAQTKHANDCALQTVVNGSGTAAATNRGSHFTANGNSLEKQQKSKDLCIPTPSSLQADVKDRTYTDQTVVQQTHNSSLPVESPLLQNAWQLNHSNETSPTAKPPQRLTGNKARVEVHKSEIRQQTTNVTANGTQLQTSTNEFSADKLPQNSAVNISQETPHQHSSNEHGRKSNSKLTRSKNVIIRRSGASRLLADDNINNKLSLTLGDKSCEDTEQIHQLVSVCDVGVLPPPPDFAD